MAHCYECHSLDRKSEGGLLLDSRQGLLKGGDSGAAIVPGKPRESLLMAAVRQTDENLKMPPRERLSDTQIADLAKWIERGAADPRVGGTASLGGRLEEGSRFWSYQPIRQPAVPVVKDTSWPQTPIDPFILHRLEQAGISPAPLADKRTLLRRVTFDLTGLPPTLEEMADFLGDDSPQAFERVVDRLLASPRYGERWGRHWLDVVRYSDTCGNASDYPVPQAHKYRDWVIATFNRDLPYDQFLRQQIAGDLLPAPSAAEQYDQVTATGYLAIARRFGGDRMGEHHLTLEDTIDNLGRAILGSSIACARCHDHKFDPFTTSDYYGLYGIFNSTRYPFPGAEVGRQQEDFVPLMSLEEIEVLLQPHRELVAAATALVKEQEAAEAEAKQLPDGPDKTARMEAVAKALAEARSGLAALQARAPVINNAYAVADGKGANAQIHVRGDPQRLGDEVARHFPAVLGGQTLPPDSTASGRRQLADWVADPQNPLTARVMANRIWQHHFGQGIVQTPNDFGRQGKPPTHPELLDDLALRFVASGWSVKSMHKLILLSRTWQASSNDVPSGVEKDPGNDLFWKFNRRRLDAESIRDALLFVSQELDEQPGGSHPFPPMSGWNWTQHNPFVALYETRQRSVYLMQQRLRKHPYLALFDGADPSSSTGSRLPSTTPLQALFLMNDPLAHQAAARFAARAWAAAPDEPGRIEFACQLAWNRPPDTGEQQQCLDFLARYRARLTALSAPAEQADQEAWAALARALLGSNEFVFVD
ncbi:MAG: PSD1 and planctomycete cytochrome C domain-containing protein [Pirellulales bacterium]